MKQAYEIAVKELGIEELSGGKHNPRILEYHSATSLKATDDETAWCSAFVNWCLIKAGIRGTNRANARSFLSWGVRVETPQKGDICVFWRGNISSAQGHVGFYVNEDLTHIIVLGGNQNNEVCFKKYPKSQLLEYRRLPPVGTKGNL